MVEIPTLFPHPLGTASSACVKFYDKFQHEAKEYDHDFMKQCDEVLNITLIFVSLFLLSFAVLRMSTLMPSNRIIRNSDIPFSPSAAEDERDAVMIALRSRCGKSPSHASSCSPLPWVCPLQSSPHHQRHHRQSRHRLCLFRSLLSLAHHLRDPPTPNIAYSRLPPST